MKCEHIHAVSCWRQGPGHYNTLFINTPANNVDDSAEDLSASGILGLKVAHAHLFFSFTLNGVKYLCVLVHWFSCTTDMLSDVTGMYTIKPDYLPNLSKDQCHKQMLDLFSEFYVN